MGGVTTMALARLRTPVVPFIIRGAVFLLRES